MKNCKVNELRERLSGRRAVLLGLGKSNISAMRFLRKIGVETEARDIKKPGDEVLEECLGLGVRVIYGDSWLDSIDCDIALRSPGIKPCDVIPYIGKAELSSETELLTELVSCPIYAVTGSDGKTTTTTVISEMLKLQFEGTGRKVWLGGNIGIPLLEHAGEIKDNDAVVLELSSFQLMTMNFSPRVAVVTNVTPNHLNWHASMEEYAGAKKNIFLNQDSDGILVVNAENAITEEYGKSAKSRVRYFSSAREADGCLKDGKLSVLGSEIMDRHEIKIPGMHNVENYLAAFLAVCDTASSDNMKKVAMTFPGVEHRIETVLEKDGVKYVNSSIDTSPTRTLAALGCFDGGIRLILGGYDKNLPLEPLAGPVCIKASAVICTGQNGTKMHDMLKTAGYKGELVSIPSFDDAVEYACRTAVHGETVLLSPASASFDAFKNFEERGERFKEIVRKEKG